MERGKVVAVNVSVKKGTTKESVDSAEFVPDHGIKGDAHAGPGNRQVSLLGTGSIRKSGIMKEQGLCGGRFAENLTTEGLELFSLPLGTLLRIGETVQQVSQIGKECHDGCAIKAAVGQCVMPREGIFTRVIRGGVVRPGDEIVVLDEDSI